MYTDPVDAMAMKRLVYKFRGSKVGRLTLVSGAGWIQKTGSDSHYTWWPLADFDIVQHCAVD